MRFDANIEKEVIDFTQGVWPQSGGLHVDQEFSQRLSDSCLTDVRSNDRRHWFRLNFSGGKG
jgi:hypothetical protein